MFERVLYPIDLTDVSITCARALTEFKKYGTEELTLFHTVEYDISMLIEGGISDVDNFITSLKDKATRKLEEVANELSKEFSKVSVKVVVALDPIAEISRVEEDFDLVVAPSRSGSPLFLGKTAEKIAKNSSIPCLLIKSRPDAGKSYYELIFRNMFERPAYILEKTNDFPGIFEHLRKFGLKKVFLVRVVDIEEALEGKVSKEELIHPLVPIPRLVEILTEYWMNEKAKLEKIKNFLSTIGVASESMVSYGSIEKCLEKISKIEGFSMAICGKRSFDKALKIADAVLILNS
jgi:nucleotide-binding universal stress UspA family protein